MIAAIICFFVVLCVGGWIIAKVVEQAAVIVAVMVFVGLPVATIVLFAPNHTPPTAPVYADDFPEIKRATAAFGYSPVRACFETIKARHGTEDELWACVEGLARALPGGSAYRAPAAQSHGTPAAFLPEPRAVQDFAEAQHEIPAVQYAVTTYGEAAVRACYAADRARHGTDDDFWSCVRALPPTSEHITTSPPLGLTGVISAVGIVIGAVVIGLLAAVAVGRLWRRASLPPPAHDSNGNATR